MGPVPPPSIYSTHFPLPPPPDLECPTDLNKNFKRANEIVTSNLESLETQNHADIPYGPLQFWELLHRYSTIVRSRFESVCEILQRRKNKPFRLVNLDRKSERVTVEDLVQRIERHLVAVSRLIENIGKQVQPSLGDLASSVPNISLRECRLWSMLNTKDFHQKLRQANGDKAKLTPIMGDVAAMICARDVMKETIPVVKLRHSSNMVTPYTIFVCLGQQEDGTRVHDLVHIGCTREYMTQWEGLYKLREEARNDRLGHATIQAWGDWHRRLVAFDSDAGAGMEGDEREKATLEARRALLQGDANALPESGKSLLGEKLRACSTHLGQAFKQLEWFQVEPVACCYMCKTSMAWKQIGDPDISCSAEIKLGKRQKCPHSCAEVAASGYCDYITRQEM
ncbi:unnamed protein product [Clonostachys solani]|uniref:Uncharacterized protein n=1 Tax=Clonostachys solani TaxID=160281 RepID=A0A9N9ZGP6_9HYPO|nr:unnamed protein product [Clonostachys solani]